MQSSKKQKHISVNKNILEASKKGALATIKDLHKRGVDLSIQDQLGKTALHYAAANGHFKVIKYLVSVKVDLNIKDFKGATALHYATENGQLKVIKYLHKNKGDIYIKDKDNNTLLHSLANTHLINIKYKPLLKFLLEQKLDLNAENNNKLNPLHFAIANNYFDMSKAFYLSLRDLPNNYRLDYLHTAVRYGHTHIAKWLLKKVPGYINVKDKEGKTPLHWSAANGHGDLTLLLLKAGAKRFAQDNMDRTPLHYAAKNGHSKVIDILLETKILFWFHNKTLLQEQQTYINVQDVHGKTSLDYVESNGNQQSKRYLFSKGALLSQPPLENSIIMVQGLDNIQHSNDNSTRANFDAVIKEMKELNIRSNNKEKCAHKGNTTHTRKFTELVTSRKQGTHISKSYSADSLVKIILQGDCSGIKNLISNTDDKDRNFGSIIK